MTEQRQKLDKLYFPIELSEIRTAELDLPVSNQAVVRKDTNEVVSVVSRDYALIKNEDVFEPLLDSFDEMDLEYVVKKVETVRNGGASLVEFRFPGMSIDIGGQKMDMQLIAHNSYDLTRTFGLILGAFRLICSNGLIVGTRIGQVTKRHYGEIDVGEQVKLVGESIDRFENTVKPLWENLNRIELGVDRGVELIESIEKRTQFPKKHGEAVAQQWETAQDRDNTPRNLWGLYNSYTNVLTRHGVNLNYQLQYGQQIDSTFQKIAKQGVDRYTLAIN
tara:strand:- start:1767 stop:2597 length:831 start_codon:yes stop_codon:yes gene_type:complete